MLRKERGAGTPRGLAEAKKAFDWLWKTVRRPFSGGKRFCLGCGRGWSTDPSGSTRHPASAVPLAPLENRHFCHGLLERKVGRQTMEIYFLKRCLQRIEQQRKLQASTGKPLSVNRSGNKSRSRRR